MQHVRIICTLSALVASPVQAHPGHGETGYGELLHYLTEPIHLASLLIAVVIAYVLIRKTRKFSNRVVPRKKGATHCPQPSQNVGNTRR